MHILESYLVMAGANVAPADQKILLNIVEYDDVSGEQLSTKAMEIWLNGQPNAVDYEAEPEHISAVTKQWRESLPQENALVQGLQTAMEAWLQHALDNGDIKGRAEQAAANGRPVWMDNIP